MKINHIVGFCIAALLLQGAFPCGPLFFQPSAAQGGVLSAAADADLAGPIDISTDGELVLLFLPGLQGFELANTRTGQRDVVSSTPCTGYFASISPDKKYVGFKDFVLAGGRRLQRPTLYDIAHKNLVPLCEPAPAAGNPVVSARGQIAYTVGEQLIVLRPDLSQWKEIALGTGVNVLAFSPNGRRLAFSDADERVSWLEMGTEKRSTIPADRLHGYQAQFAPDGRAMLARSSNGEITACDLSTGASRSFGAARSAAWVDADTVALVRKTVANYRVSDTRVLKARLSDGSSSTLLTKQGNAELAVNASVVAVVAEDGVSLADTRTGTLAKAAILPRAASATDAATGAPSVIKPLDVVTNTTIVQLTGVPYIHQAYDTADDFPGDSACNATATLMAIQYYNKLPANPITCHSGGTHVSQYGFYISSIYSYNGHTFNIPSTSIWGSSLAGWYGGFGYFLQDTRDNSLLHSTRLSEWVTDHGLTSGTDDAVTGETGFLKALAEVDANHPTVVLNDLTSAGHYITCIGYVIGQHSLIFNDPWGNKAISYPGWAGAGARYDWPGYNTGYPNLNGVERYIYARGTLIPPGNYTLAANVSGSGTVAKSPDLTSYAPNATVTLTATATSGSSFLGWSGDATGTANPLSLTMTANKSVTANFSGGVSDIIIDDVDSGFATPSGSWFTGTSSTDKYGADYRYATAVSGSAMATATYTPAIVAAGNYDVYIWYPQGSNRSTSAPWTVFYNGGSVTLTVNQQANGGTWVLIASGKPFALGSSGYVQLANNTSDAGKVVMADAVKLSYSAMQPPVIITPPQSQTVNAGSGVTFTVSASGGSLSYQWQFKGVNISGATASSYTRANVQSSDAGAYAVVVSNTAGSTTSSSATLGVNVAPAITVQPQDQTVCRGGSAAFAVSASGTAPLGYQWRFKGVSIASATASSYTKSGVQTNDAGSYSVVVSNIAGMVTSRQAVLTVTLPNPPHITGIQMLAGGQIQLWATCDAGHYAIDATTNLRDWTEVTNFTTTNASFQYAGPAAGLARRFYRARLIP